MTGVECATSGGTQSELERREHPFFPTTWQFRCNCSGSTGDNIKRQCTMHIWDCPVRWQTKLLSTSLKVSLTKQTLNAWRPDQFESAVLETDSIYHQPEERNVLVDAVKEEMEMEDPLGRPLTGEAERRRRYLSLLCDLFGSSNTSAGVGLKNLL